MATTGMTSSTPLVSVCIANYNGMEVIDDCLRSVREQEGHIPVEILVHDDASSDGSAPYIRNRYSDVSLIESSANVGFCVANNRMADVAKGKYLLLLNNDAALYRDALLTLLDEANRLEQSAILGLPQYDVTTGKLIDIGCLFDLFLNPVPNSNPQLNNVGMVIGACLWVPKGLWVELGGFPEWFESIAEDMYLCCRARLAGYPIRALSKSGYRHWQGKSFSGNRVANNRLATTVRRRVLSERNKTFVMVMTYPAPLFQTLLPLHLLLLLIEGALLAMIKRDRNLFWNIYFACLANLWRERQRLSMLRKTIQSTRKIDVARWFSVFLVWPHKLRLLAKHGVPRIR